TLPPTAPHRGHAGADPTVALGHTHAHPRVDHRYLATVRRPKHARSFARCPWRKVDRPQQPRLPLDEHQRFLLVERMIAERDYVSAGADQLLEDLLGDPEASGGVLSVDDHKIELVATPQPW